MTRSIEKRSDAVWVARGELVVAGPAEAAFLAEKVRDAARRRVRICAHPGDDAPLQEMLVLLERGTYIRPHRHFSRAESLLALEGEADAVFFDEEGGVTRVLALGAAGSGRDFYYRLEAPVYHTLLLRTERFLYHEATTGPFRPETSAAAPWAPAEDEGPAVASWDAALQEKVWRFREGPV